MLSAKLNYVITSKSMLQRFKFEHLMYLPLFGH